MVINSKVLGRFEFTQPHDGGYIYCNGKQICQGGGWMGATISAPSTKFEEACRAWYRAHYRMMKRDNPHLWDQG